MRSMSENAKLFGSLARHIRRSTCPTTGHQNEVRADCGLANSPISDHRRCLLRPHPGTARTRECRVCAARC
jgi:hypothetical protein